ncbi:MAG: S9 family peptidase [Pirellulales bacterium]|nr:S9 family peptidase [Pirellulales bacterium]
MSMRRVVLGSCVMRRLMGLCLLYTAMGQPVCLGAEAADPRRPPAIRSEHVPEVPEELAERLRQYQNTRAASFAGWAPDGRGLLVQTRFGNAPQLHRVYVPGGRREQLTFFDEPVGGQFIPQAEDGALLVTMSRGGNENDQIYLFQPLGGRAVLLTDGTSRNLLGPVRDDGTRMVVHSTQRNGRDTDLYIADCRRPGSMELVLEVNNEFWTCTDWSQDGRLLALLRYVSINESYPALLDLHTRQVQPLPLAAAAPVAVGSLVFTPDANAVYLTTDARGEFLELARLDLASGQYSWLSADIPWDVTDVQVDRHTGQVAFCTNEDGASRLYLLEADRPRAVELPLGIVAGMEFSPDSRQLGFTLARPDAPAEAYSLVLASGELVRWTYSETGGLDPATFVQPERIQFSSFDGRQIPAYYYRPPQASPDRPVPVLIDIHGGPESQYRPTFSGMTQYYLHELGLAVIFPNVRGSAGYGKSYLKLDNGMLREDSVRDIGALLDWIAQQAELDARRVGVIGGSYGGYMVLASLTHFGERIRAGVDIVGIANFVSFLERTSPYRQDLRRAEYGDERDPQMRAFFEQISPVNRADRIRSALLVAHGVNDPRVPFSEAQQIAEVVRAQGRPVWTVYAENEGHGFAKKDNRDYLTAVIAMFLRQHLQ